MQQHNHNDDLQSVVRFRTKAPVSDAEGSLRPLISFRFCPKPQFLVMDDKKMAVNLRNDDLSEETKTLISSLPSDKDSTGINVCKYQGCWYTHHFLQAVLNFQKNFKPQDTNIIVASFPKCGTTWLKALTFSLVHRSKHPSHDHHHPLLSNNPHVLVP